MEIEMLEQEMPERYMVTCDGCHHKFNRRSHAHLLRTVSDFYFCPQCTVGGPSSICEKTYQMWMLTDGRKFGRKRLPFEEPRWENRPY